MNTDNALENYKDLLIKDGSLTELGAILLSFVAIAVINSIMEGLLNESNLQDNVK